jgi:hypothetical protein
VRPLTAPTPSRSSPLHARGAAIGQGYSRVAAIRPIFRAANLEEARRLLEETAAHLESGCPRWPAS